MADVVTRNFEMTVGLTALALSTTKTRIASTVTNPLVRHPGVNAAAFASLQKISGGRMIFGIATGHSMVTNLGLRRARLDEVREHVDAFRALLERGHTVYRGRECRVPWAPELVEKRVPVFIAAEGPKALRCAGEIADGVLTGRGFARDIVEETLADIRRGADAAGRNPNDIEVWFHAPVAVHDDPTSAMNAVLGDAVNAIAMPGPCTALTSSEVSDETKRRIRRLRERYNPARHAARGDENARLAREEGLDAFLAAWFAIAGTPEDAARRIREVEALGVDRLYVTTATSDPHQLLTRLLEAHRLSNGRH
jgi:5,10-methylenetetrahydromethanopterin reductase